jgi:hypothetical protein
MCLLVTCSDRPYLPRCARDWSATAGSPGLGGGPVSRKGNQVTGFGNHGARMTKVVSHGIGVGEQRRQCRHSLPIGRSSEEGDGQTCTWR